MEPADYRIAMECYLGWVGGVGEPIMYPNEFMLYPTREYSKAQAQAAARASLPVDRLMMAKVIYVGGADYPGEEPLPQGTFMLRVDEEAAMTFRFLDGESPEPVP
jgi:hypothetical protein